MDNSDDVIQQIIKDLNQLSASLETLLNTEKEDILGRIYQECRYPCFVVYRSTTGARERQKITILEFLDTLGRWLCHEPSGIEGKEYEKAVYPDLTAGRKIERVTRGNAYGTQPQENGVQDWVLPVTVYYKNVIEHEF